MLVWSYHISGVYLLALSAGYSVSEQFTHLKLFYWTGSGMTSRMHVLAAIDESKRVMCLLGRK